MQKIKKQKGAIVFILTVILMMAAEMIVLYAAQYGILQQKAASNQYQATLAYKAAEAGLEYGLAYLNQNVSTIIANPLNGFLNYGSISSITNVLLGNNSQYSIVFTNPVQGNFQLIQITATGTSPDGTATRTIRQQVYAGGTTLKYAITTPKNLTVSGNVNVTGGSGVDIGGTLTKSGVFNSSGITQPDAQLAAMSASDLFQGIFGVSSSTMQANSTYYASTSGINWATLSGNVWINSNVTLSGNRTIGSILNPVLLIVNGNFTNSGTITINGILYVMGTTTASGRFTINGGLVSLGSITTSGSTSGYNQTIVSKFTANQYAKVSGSWRDF